MRIDKCPVGVISDVYEKERSYDGIVYRDFAVEVNQYGEIEYVNDRAVDAANKTRDRR